MQAFLLGPISALWSFSVGGYVLFSEPWGKASRSHVIGCVAVTWRRNPWTWSLGSNDASLLACCRLEKPALVGNGVCSVSGNFWCKNRKSNVAIVGLEVLNTRVVMRPDLGIGKGWKLIGCAINLGIVITASCPNYRFSLLLKLHVYIAAVKG